MRGKVIYRIACGTCCVCMTYGIIAQSFEGLDAGKAAAEWLATPAAIEFKAEPTPTPDVTVSDLSRAASEEAENNTWQQSGGKRLWGAGQDGKRSGGKGGHSRGMMASAENTVTAPDSTEDDEKKKNLPSEEQREDESEQDNGTSDNPPTLAQYLSALRCGGCRHNCCLISPRCMKGKSKMQTATVQYEETYGG